LKDELNKLHLINPKTQQYNAVISLRCGTCKTLHPKSPAALIWWKCLKDKDQLICPKCKGKNFVRTHSHESQGELLSNILANKTKKISKRIEDEVGEQDYVDLK